MALPVVPWDFCVTSFLLIVTGRQKQGCHKGSRTGFKRYFRAGVSVSCWVGRAHGQVCKEEELCPDSWEASSGTLACPSRYEYLCLPGILGPTGTSPTSRGAGGQGQPCLHDQP